MLVAFNEHEQAINLLHYAREDLYTFRKNHLFYCPICKQKLLLKIGAVKKPHFSHTNINVCLESLYKREGEIHLIGKEKLYRHFSSLQQSVSLEPYLSEIQQRPDLLITHRNKKYAIEFQCSAVERSIIQQRTANYIKANIHPIWIIQTPPTVLKRASTIRKIRLSKFQQMFIRENESFPYLLTMHPQTNLFYYVTPLLFLYGDTYLTATQTFPIEKQTFPLLKPSKIPYQLFYQLMKTYLSIKNNYVMQRLYYSKKGVNDILLRSIYDLKISRHDVPNYIGVPTKCSDAIPLFTVEWQSALLRYCLMNKLSVTALQEQTIKDFLTYLNLPYNAATMAAVTSYSQFLEMLHIHPMKEKISNDQLFELLYLHIVALWCEN